jgi:hypothetical protein
MTEPRNLATFNAELPDDSEWSEAGDNLVPEGRGACLLIMEIARKIGLEVSEPYQHSHYGWALDAKIGASKFWILLQYADAWLLIFEDRTGILGRMKSGRMSLLDLLHQMNDALNAHDIISDIRWFSSKEFESNVSAGHETPEER